MPPPSSNQDPPTGEPATDPSGASGDDSVRSIGSGIRSERKRRGWTMGELAERVGITAGAVGMIERDETDPSLSSLRRISEALDVPMFQFLLGEADRSIVVRRDARVRIAIPIDDVDYELLSSSVTGALELLWVKLGPGSATRDAAAAHTAEECTVVTRGTAIAEIGGRRIVLGEGDSVTIGSGLPHRFINETSTDTELLLALSPSTF